MPMLGQNKEGNVRIPNLKVIYTNYSKNAEGKNVGFCFL